MRTRIIAVTAAVIGAIALAGCGSIAASQPAASQPAASHSATPAASAAAAAAQAPASPPSQAQQIAAWATGPGYDAMQTVQADLGQLSTDADAGDMQATETDGATLAADAQVAEDSPPPVGTATYATAMQAYVSAGNEAAAGDFASATVNLDEGTALIASTTTAITNAES